MQGLCEDQVEHFSDYLFSDNLNTSIKEISEHKKISPCFMQEVSLPVVFEGVGFVGNYLMKNIN